MSPLAVAVALALMRSVVAVRKHAMVVPAGTPVQSMSMPHARPRSDFTVSVVLLAVLHPFCVREILRSPVTSPAPAEPTDSGSAEAPSFPNLTVPLTFPVSAALSFTAVPVRSVM